MPRYLKVHHPTPHLGPQRRPMGFYHPATRARTRRGTRRCADDATPVDCRGRSVGRGLGGPSGGALRSASVAARLRAAAGQLIARTGPAGVRERDLARRCALPRPNGEAGRSGAGAVRRHRRAYALAGGGMRAPRAAPTPRGLRPSALPEMTPGGDLADFGQQLTLGPPPSPTARGAAAEGVFARSTASVPHATVCAVPLGSAASPRYCDGLLSSPRDETPVAGDRPAGPQKHRASSSRLGAGGRGGVKPRRPISFRATLLGPGRDLARRRQPHFH